jgi:hypothetical protein
MWVPVFAASYALRRVYGSGLWLGFPVSGSWFRGKGFGWKALKKIRAHICTVQF